VKQRAWDRSVQGATGWMLIVIQGHVNNVNYFRYAESARVNWITNFAVHADPAHRKQWSELMTPNSVGLIMRTLKCEFKFVRPSHPLLLPSPFSLLPEGKPD